MRRSYGQWNGVGSILHIIALHGVNGVGLIIVISSYRHLNPG